MYLYSESNGSVAILDRFSENPSLHGKRAQRAVGRFTGQDPRITVAGDGRVVNECGDPSECCKVRVPLPVGWFPIQENLSLGCVACASNLVRTVGCHDGLDCHFVLREGAGLVRANGRDRTEGFHGVHAARDRVPSRHLLHAERKRNGQDCREAFGVY